LMQMHQTTQQNAALVEEASAASQAIVEQAQALNGMISRYNVGSDGAARQGAKVAPVAGERRSGARPWSNRSVAEGAKAPAVPARKVVGGADGEWKEF
jgi:methyl-accepting chemotaxis protein